MARHHWCLHVTGDYKTSVVVLSAANRHGNTQMGFFWGLFRVVAILWNSLGK